jgi:hypothetical protein
VVEVVAGTAPYSVRLATTRTPAGEDEATLQPGETVVLRTDDVDWGETIDGRLEYTAGDGSGIAYTDELDEYSFTRPTREDCEAATAPTTPHPVPTTTPSSPPSTTAPRPAPGGNSGGAPAPSTTAPSPTGPATSSPAGGAPMDGPDGDDAQAVTAGDTVTLQASGFLPGERVTIRLQGSDEVLGSAIAGPDGSVRAEVRIPHRTAAGPATVDLVGDDSAVVADVALQVAGSETILPGDGVGDLVPLTAAAVALVAAVGGLVSVAGRQRFAAREPHAGRRA